MYQKENNTKACQFNIAIKNQVANIVEPLEKLLPITNFSYLRFYDDNKLLHIQPNHELLETLLQSNYNDQGLKNEKLRKVVQDTVTESQFIWPSNSPDDLSRFLYKFGLNNTMSIITKKDSYIESLTFSNSLDENSGIELYVKHKDVYKHFYHYFLNRLEDFVDFSDKDIYFQTTLNEYYKREPSS